MMTMMTMKILTGWMINTEEDVEKSEPESKTESDPIINYRYVPKNANSWEQND
jgi:hypothetical protein